MDILISLLIVISILISIVVFQSRKDRPAIRVYLHRFSKLIMILVSIFKNIGVCAAQQVRQANWDLTATRVVTPPVDPSQMDQQTNAPSQNLDNPEMASAQGDTCPNTQSGGRRNKKTRKASWY
jgi:hypothetical protein